MTVRAALDALDGATARSPRVGMRRVALPACCAVLALAGVAAETRRAAPEAAPSDGVQELANVLDLRAAFEADAGKPRVLFLFSPT